MNKIICGYHYQNVDGMIYSIWDIEKTMLKLIISGLFCTVILLKTPNIKIAEMKKFPGDIILHMCTKNHHHMIYGSWDTEWDKQNFLPFWAISCPFTTYRQKSQKSKFWKRKKKKMSADIAILYVHVYHKWRSYDIWFLKYKVWQTEIFVILGDIILYIWTINDNHMMYGSWDMECIRIFFIILGGFLSFYFPMDPENHNFEKRKSTWKCSNVYHKWKSYYV